MRDYMKALILLVVMLGSLSAFAAEKKIVAACSMVHELAIGRNGTKAVTDMGWVQQLSWPKTEYVCQFYASRLTNVFKNLTLKQFADATLICRADSDGTRRIYADMNGRTLRMLTLLGDSDDERTKSCGEILYNLQCAQELAENDLN